MIIKLTQKMTSQQNICMYLDINSDKRTRTAELIYILQKVAGFKEEVNQL
ncbi:hypothetical protein GMMP1_460006 [Candidatus Magnetomoraceae bacterium gMMP-1]